MNRRELKTLRDKQFNAGNYREYLDISGKHFNFPENIQRKLFTKRDLQNFVDKP